MEIYDNEKSQWLLQVVVLHGPQFSHRVLIEHGRPSGRRSQRTIGKWTGMGIPSHVLIGITSSVQACIEDHLFTRYGEQDPLSLVWGAKDDPF